MRICVEKLGDGTISFVFVGVSSTSIYVSMNYHVPPSEKKARLFSLAC